MEQYELPDIYRTILGDKDLPAQDRIILMAVISLWNSGELQTADIREMVTGDNLLLIADAAGMPSSFLTGRLRDVLASWYTLTETDDNYVIPTPMPSWDEKKEATA